MKAVISSGICAVRSAGVLANALYSYYEIKKISDEAEYSDKKSKVHSTVANEILKVCKKNQGVYVKIG